MQHDNSCHQYGNPTTQYPPMPDTYRMSRRGIAAVQSRAANLGQIWRENPTGDVGIDGHLELVRDDGTATAIIVGVQVKSGASYLKRPRQQRLPLLTVRQGPTLLGEVPGPGPPGPARSGHRAVLLARTSAKNIDHIDIPPNVSLSSHDHRFCRDRPLHNCSLMPA